MSGVTQEEIDYFELVKRKREIESLLRDYNRPGDLSGWMTKAVLVLLRAAKEDLEERSR